MCLQFIMIMLQTTSKVTKRKFTQMLKYIHEEEKSTSTSDPKYIEDLESSFNLDVVSVSKVKYSRHEKIKYQGLELTLRDHDNKLNLKLRQKIINFINEVLFELVNFNSKGIDIDKYPDSKLKRLVETIGDYKDTRSIIKYYRMFEDIYYDFVWALVLNNHQMNNKKYYDIKNHQDNFKIFIGIPEYITLRDSSKLFQLLFKYKDIVCEIK